jgi:hypothetical protein
VEFNIENETRNGKGKMIQRGQKDAEYTKGGINNEKMIQIVGMKLCMKLEAPKLVTGGPGCILGAERAEGGARIIRNPL